MVFKRTHNHNLHFSQALVKKTISKKHMNTARSQTISQFAAAGATGMPMVSSHDNCHTTTSPVQAHSSKPIKRIQPSFHLPIQPPTAAALSCQSTCTPHITAALPCEDPCGMPPVLPTANQAKAWALVGGAPSWIKRVEPSSPVQLCQNSGVSFSSCTQRA